MRAAALVVLVAACRSEKAEPKQVTIAPPTTSASAPIEAPYAENARSAFDAAEALERAGRTNEARTAYEEIVRKYGYSLSARQARERLAAMAANENATVGDVTCNTDADCTVTTKRECCECCPRKALATSKKWLEWSDHACGLKKCAGCDESCPPETGRTARCNTAQNPGRCELIKK